MHRDLEIVDLMTTFFLWKQSYKPVDLSNSQKSQHRTLKDALVLPEKNNRVCCGTQ